MAVVTECWTDGSGTMARSPGGWAYVLRALKDGQVIGYKEGHGGLEDTTNNRAELTAVIEGLLVLKKRAAVTVFSDSEYVVNGATRYLSEWLRNGWRTREGDPVVNQDLWQEIAGARKMHAVRFTWVRGHYRRFRCTCGWDGDKPEDQKGKRIVLCPDCGERTTAYDPYPVNARCDDLAGDERRAMFELAALREQNPEWALMVCPVCAGNTWGPVGMTMCANGHDQPKGVQMIAAVKAA